MDLFFCYEASYSGFDLYSKMKANGMKCEVIAPSLIPQKSRGKSQAGQA